MKTKISSAAIPITKKMPIMFSVPKYGTLRIQVTRTDVSGKLRKMIETEIRAINFDPKLKEK